MQSGTKDGWDKVEIVLQPLGGFLTALAVGYIGILGSQYLKHKESVETDTQLYAELLSKKQEQDTAFRRDMLKPMIDGVNAPGTSIESKMVNLELLEANFQESLDLSPMLKNMYRQLQASTGPTKDRYLRNIERLAQEVKTRQLVVLGGQTRTAGIDFDDLKRHPEGVTIIDTDLRLHSDDADDVQKRHFKVTVMDLDSGNKEAQVWLRVQTPRTVDKHTEVSDSDGPELDVVFSIGWFDFPQASNFSLLHAQRCALVVRAFSPSSAQITLVYFPESSEDPVQVLKRKLIQSK
jgi:hypothetical protein